MNGIFDNLSDSSNKMLTMKDTLTFGKHKGEVIGDILETDPTYLQWCIDNIEWFEMSRDDILLIVSCAEDAREDEREESHYWDPKWD